MLKKFCQCIGLASLILVMNYGDLLGGGADVRMHVPYSLTGVCLAQIADILLLGFALFVVLIALKSTRFYSWVRLLFVFLVPPYLIERTQTLFPFEVSDGLVLVLAIVWAALLLLLLLRFPQWYRRLVRVGDAAGVFLAIFGICSMAQLLWIMHWHPGRQQIQASWMAGAQPPRHHPLLVWIIFDELSYDQLFQLRAHDLALPNIDALRSQSTLFTEMQPIGLKTVKIIPSLFSGGAIDDYRYSFDNRFTVHYAGQHGWHPLDGNGTVFHDAQLVGWRTAAVGWYNPYCTIYGSALDSCYWSNLDRTDGNMAQRAGFWSNAWSPLANLGTELHSPALAAHESCDIDVRQRYQTHQDLEQHSLQVVASDQADFIFLHFDIPHSPNIWSRTNDAYTQSCGSSYLDNLALVDRELGQLLTTLQSSPRWKDTTLIVQGDHSWRTMLWDWMPSWTEEDEQASRGGFDPRPALLIHNAGQTQPRTDSRAMPLLYVHSAIENVLHGHEAEP
ncbi:sulfatase-like hydrolase/transferase [Granulicella arctica]|uniref:Uncharacterized protein with PQ loop repeat n=1 Tax=Granulicella arctica TaxID=940613 RepID=A0A7Y9TFH2_9BACT|nr:sulfatase-like hydrolase/transferase [Granulicella arctica]NYF78339.1 uncharacterized protein with PQ loop repeat [Granulicella arctica]